MLTRQSLPTAVSSSRELNTFQNQVTAFVNAIARVPTLNGNLIQDIVFTGTDPVKVGHQLGRRPIGYMVTKADAGLQVWDLDSDNTELPEQYLVLRFTGSATADLWIF